uniref:Uncharacterized protein n=1 Tax=Rhizophora mucronata TaxID=61149 RepID=A0A2P2QKD5_RHIMU
MPYRSSISTRIR